MTPRPVQIVPSVLPADFAKLGAECAALEAAGADRIQWDVMDGQFVPNITFGPDVIAAARKHTALMFEAHLMVEEPDNMLAQWVDAGCQMLIIHAESTTHLDRTLNAVRDLGAQPAVALSPATPIEAIINVLDLVDMVLVMTVNPGFGGQSYIARMESKLRRLRSHIDQHDLDIDIEIDGGVSAETIAGAAEAGANIFISGSALFKYPEGLAHGVKDLRTRAETAQHE